MSSLQFSTYKDEHNHQVKEVYFAAFTNPPWEEGWRDVEHVGRYIDDCIGMPNFKGFVALHKNRVIAGALGRVVHWWLGEDFGLEAFFVHPSHQRKGVGTFLFMMMKSELLKHDITHISLSADRDMPSYVFYKKMGFDCLADAVSMHVFLDRE